MSTSIETKLNQAINLQKQKVSEISQISRMQFRTIARIRLPIYEDQKKMMIDQACHKYDSEIRKLYKEINAEQRMNNLPEYHCPVDGQKG